MGARADVADLLAGMLVPRTAAIVTTLSRKCKNLVRDLAQRARITDYMKLFAAVRLNLEWYHRLETGR
jgi:hypothetical protein